MLRRGLSQGRRGIQILSIENEPYQLKDPTDRLTHKLSAKLQTLKRNGIYQMWFTTTSGPNTNSRIESTVYRRSIRPIVSCVNTLAYDLSTYLANILSPLTGKSEFTVTNSAYFESTISSETILDNEIMVSFDVESLFTNVPIDFTVQAAL